MHTTARIIASCALFLASAAPLHAQSVIAYPAKGQSAEQQKRDQGECRIWAKETTGIDPAALAAAPPPPSSSYGGGERARGAARGAVGGLVIGEIAGGHGGEGAAIGAIVGGMRGGQRARDNAAARDQAAQQQRQQTLDTYNRAYAACMQGRGYTVN